MSITMNLYYTGKDGSAVRFAQEMTRKGLVKRIREREGNERYEYFISFDDPETVLLIDRWTDQKALDEHHSSHMMEEIATLRERYDLRMRAERYVDADQTEADERFIRK